MAAADWADLSDGGGDTGGEEGPEKSWGSFHMGVVSEKTWIQLRSFGPSLFLADPTGLKWPIKFLLHFVRPWIR